MLLTAFPVAASEGRIVSPAAGQTLRAGDVVEVRWTAFEQPVEELEILLAVDGEGRFPVRLTDQLDPRLRSVRWHVPDLPTPAAFLFVRFGRHGCEVAAQHGGVFRIAGAARAPLAAPGFTAGEWWLGRGTPGAPVGSSGARPIADWLAEVIYGLPALVRGGRHGARISSQLFVREETPRLYQSFRIALPARVPRVAVGLPRLE